MENQWKSHFVNGTGLSNLFIILLSWWIFHCFFERFKRILQCRSHLNLFLEFCTAGELLLSLMRHCCLRTASLSLQAIAEIATFLSRGLLKKSKTHFLEMVSFHNFFGFRDWCTKWSGQQSGVLNAACEAGQAMWYPPKNLKNIFKSIICYYYHKNIYLIWYTTLHFENHVLSTKGQ